MTPSEIAHKQEQIDKAHEMVSALCNGYRKWIMSVPARRDYDPDLVITDGLMAGAAALAALREMQWRPIESAPKDMTPVWLAYKNSYGKNRFAHAQYLPRYTEENDTDYAEYCEEKDEYYTPEGWYEICENWDDFSAMKICGAEFIAWMPLPAPPAQNAAQTGETT